MGPLSTGGHHRLTHAADERAGGPPTVGGPPPHRTFPDLLERVSFFSFGSGIAIRKWRMPHSKPHYRTVLGFMAVFISSYGVFFVAVYFFLLLNKVVIWFRGFLFWCGREADGFPDLRTGLDRVGSGFLWVAALP